MQFGNYAKVCPEQEKEVRISPSNEPSEQYREEDSELYSEQEDSDSFRHYLIRKLSIDVISLYYQEIDQHYR